MLRFLSGGTNYIIPGFHGEVVGETPEVPTSSKYLWGLRGHVLIIGRQSKRQFTVDIWLNDPTWTTADLFYIGLRQLESIVGLHGDLYVEADAQYGVWAVSAEQLLANVQLASIQPMTFQGQRTSSPVQDFAACLYAQSTNEPVRENQSWAQKYRIVFTQTLPGRLPA